MPNVKDSLTIFLIIITFLNYEIQECTCLKITNFEVPTTVSSGSTTLLKCLFELEQDKLVNLKWYFNNKEILRFEPKSKREETQIFQLPALNLERANVINSADRGSIIRLEDVNKEMSGKYKCEVTIERLFFTMYKESDMNVIPQMITTTSIPSYHRPKQLDLDSVEEESQQTSEVASESVESGCLNNLNWFNILNIMLIVYGLMLCIDSSF